MADFLTKYKLPLDCIDYGPYDGGEQLLDADGLRFTGQELVDFFNEKFTDPIKMYLVQGSDGKIVGGRYMKESTAKGVATRWNKLYADCYDYRKDPQYLVTFSAKIYVLIPL